MYKLSLKKNIWTLLTRLHNYNKFIRTFDQNLDIVYNFTKISTSLQLHLIERSVRNYLRFRNCLWRQGPAIQILCLVNTVCRQEPCHSEHLNQHFEQQLITLQSANHVPSRRRWISYLVFWAEQRSLNPFLQITLDFGGATNATPLINPPRFVTAIFWPKLNLVSWFRSDLSHNSAGADWKIHKFWVAITTQAAATPVLKMRKNKAPNPNLNLNAWNLPTS